MKKLLSCMVSLGLVVSLAGCGGGGGSTADTTPAPMTAAQTTAAESKAEEPKEEESKEDTSGGGSRDHRCCRGYEPGAGLDCG